MYYVYMLQCGDGSLYTGSSNDPEQRLKVHRNGLGAKYTRQRQPLQLVYRECCFDKSSALRREAAIKRLSRTQKLALIVKSRGRVQNLRQIINVGQRPAYAETALGMLQEHWGSGPQGQYYAECLQKSLAAAAPQPLWYLITLGAELVGCAGLAPDPHDAANSKLEFKLFYIKETAQGQGLEELLWRQAYADAAEAGYREIYAASSQLDPSLHT